MKRENIFIHSAKEEKEDEIYSGGIYAALSYVGSVHCFFSQNIIITCQRFILLKIVFVFYEEDEEGKLSLCLFNVGENYVYFPNKQLQKKVHGVFLSSSLFQPSLLSLFLIFMIYYYANNCV